MGEQRKAFAALGSFGRFFRTMLIGLIIAAVAMVGGYHGMRHYLGRNDTEVRRDTYAAAVEAAQLRRDTNAVVRLMEDYLLRFPLTERAGSVQAERWAVRDFLPAVDVLRRRLAEARQGGQRRLAAHQEIRTLLDRMATMAAHPADQALRRATAEHLEALCAQVNHYILGLDDVGRLDEPPLPFTVRAAP